MLCERGAEVNKTGSLYNTALHAAAGGGHLDVIRILHKHGADLDYRDLWGRTAVDCAIEREEKVAESLLRELGGLTGKMIDEQINFDRVNKDTGSWRSA